ncbi:hypothetical protein [Stieleria varia]|uniref:PEP-CTERM protein-sorting domain-containing protein n=1 Tax=Stieleria varia TaxID=2528005 RepID=A0A5C6B3E4_9BACT|nr:hypothetical protein [Stieleria varia]TWU05981.1 hypothetical protein Pla52n_16970 [Stieleria varia]
MKSYLLTVVVLFPPLCFAASEVQADVVFVLDAAYEVRIDSVSGTGFTIGGSTLEPITDLFQFGNTDGSVDAFSSVIAADPASMVTGDYLFGFASGDGLASAPPDSLHSIFAGADGSLEVTNTTAAELDITFSLGYSLYAETGGSDLLPSTAFATADFGFFEDGISLFERSVTSDRVLGGGVVNDANLSLITRTIAPGETRTFDSFVAVNGFADSISAVPEPNAFWIGFVFIILGLYANDIGFLRTRRS